MDVAKSVRFATQLEASREAGRLSPRSMQRPILKQGHAHARARSETGAARAAAAALAVVDPHELGAHPLGGAAFELEHLRGKIEHEAQLRAAHLEDMKGELRLRAGDRGGVCTSVGAGASREGRGADLPFRGRADAAVRAAAQLVQAGIDKCGPMLEPDEDEDEGEKGVEPASEEDNGASEPGRIIGVGDIESDGGGEDGAASAESIGAESAEQSGPPHGANVCTGEPAARTGPAAWPQFAVGGNESAPQTAGRATGGHARDLQGAGPLAAGALVPGEVRASPPSAPHCAKLHPASAGAQIARYEDELFEEEPREALLGSSTLIEGVAVSGRDEKGKPSRLADAAPYRHVVQDETLRPHAVLDDALKLRAVQFVGHAYAGAYGPAGGAPPRLPLSPSISVVEHLAPMPSAAAPHSDSFLDAAESPRAELPTIAVCEAQSTDPLTVERNTPREVIEDDPTRTSAVVGSSGGPGRLHRASRDGSTQTKMAVVLRRPPLAMLRAARRRAEEGYHAGVRAARAEGGSLSTRAPQHRQSAGFQLKGDLIPSEGIAAADGHSAAPRNTLVNELARANGEWLRSSTVAIAEVQAAEAILGPPAPPSPPPPLSDAVRRLRAVRTLLAERLHIHADAQRQHATRAREIRRQIAEEEADASARVAMGKARRQGGGGFSSGKSCGGGGCDGQARASCSHTVGTSSHNAPTSCSGSVFRATLLNELYQRHMMKLGMLALRCHADRRAQLNALVSRARGRAARHSACTTLHAWRGACEARLAGRRRMQKFVEKQILGRAMSSWAVGLRLARAVRQRLEIARMQHSRAVYAAAFAHWESLWLWKLVVRTFLVGSTAWRRVRLAWVTLRGWRSVSERALPTGGASRIDAPVPVQIQASLRAYAKSMSHARAAQRTLDQARRRRRFRIETRIIVGISPMPSPQHDVERRGVLQSLREAMRAKAKRAQEASSELATLESGSDQQEKDESGTCDLAEVLLSSPREASSGEHTDEAGAVLAGGDLAIETECAATERARAHAASRALRAGLFAFGCNVEERRAKRDAISAAEGYARGRTIDAALMGLWNNMGAQARTRELHVKAHKHAARRAMGLALRCFALNAVARAQRSRLRALAKKHAKYRTKSAGLLAFHRNVVEQARQREMETLAVEHARVRALSCGLLALHLHVSDRARAAANLGCARLHRLRTVLRSWAGAAVERSSQRDAAIASDVIMARTYMARWHRAAREARTGRAAEWTATKHFTAKALAQAMDMWRSATTASMRMRTAIDAAVAHDRRKTLRSALATYRAVVATSVAHERYVRMARRGRAQKLLLAWRNVTANDALLDLLRQQGEHVARQQLLRRSLTWLRDRAAKRRLLRRVFGRAEALWEARCAATCSSAEADFGRMSAGIEGFKRVHAMAQTERACAAKDGAARAHFRSRLMCAAFNAWRDSANLAWTSAVDEVDLEHGDLVHAINSAAAVGTVRGRTFLSRLPDHMPTKKGMETHAPNRDLAKAFSMATEMVRLRKQVVALAEARNDIVASSIATAAAQALLPLPPMASSVELAARAAAVVRAGTKL